MSIATNTVRTVFAITGGYLVVWDDFTADAICAYEDAEDAADKAAEQEGVPLHAYHMVCGWNEADDLLRKFGVDPDEPMFSA